MAKLTDLFVSKTLFVGTANKKGLPVPPVGFGVGPTQIRGTAYIEGPMMVGDPTAFTKGPNVNEANLMVARNANIEAIPEPISILKVSSLGSPPTALDVMLGDPAGPVGVSVNSILINIVSPITNGVGILNWTGAKTLTGAEVLTGVKAQAGAEARTGGKVINGATVINGALVVNGATNINGFLKFSDSIVGKTKLFDIPHPTKNNFRLRHVCLEGPEAGVYYRGRLKDKNVIELPEYWKGLVDSETITVNLTPHGSYQELFVKSIEWGSRVIIVNNAGGPIDCSYVVYAERKDVDKLVVEYEGTEPKEQ